MSGCPRTPGLVDRAVADRLSAADRAHAAGCSWCGPVLARAAAFDDALRRSARSLVTEHLPAGTLEATLTGRPAGLVTSRLPAPGLAATLAALVILLSATVVALVPGGGPSPSPTSTPPPSASPATTRTPLAARFRSTDAIRGGLAKVSYSCNDGGAIASPGSGPDAVARDAAVCVAPASIGPVSAAVIIGEAAGGDVVEVAVKGELSGDTTENRATFANVVATAFAVSLLDEGARQNGASWARVHVPELELGDAVDYEQRGLRFHAERGLNGYYVSVHPVGKE